MHTAIYSVPVRPPWYIYDSSDEQHTGPDVSSSGFDSVHPSFPLDSVPRHCCSPAPSDSSASHGSFRGVNPFFRVIDLWSPTIVKGTTLVD
jgi:hypothetical protein